MMATVTRCAEDVEREEVFAAAEAELPFDFFIFPNIPRR
jgi:hypothetical protein